MPSPLQINGVTPWWLLLFISLLWFAGAVAAVLSLRAKGSAVDRSLLTIGVVGLLLLPTVGWFSHSLLLLASGLAFAPFAVSIVYLVGAFVTPNKGAYRDYYLTVGMPLFLIAGMGSFVSAVTLSFLTGNPGH